MIRPLERALPPSARVAQLFAVGIAFCAVIEVRPARAQTVEFQHGFMRQNSEHSEDVSALALKSLSEKNALPPGRYRVALRINQNYFAEREITFESNPQNNGLSPCLNAELLKEMGVRSETFRPEHNAQACIDLPNLISGASFTMDNSTLRLSVSIPHIAMRRDIIGFVPVGQWQTGINAAFLNYQVSAQQGNSRYLGSRESQDMNLTSGLNLGAWRFRSNQSLRQNDDGQREWLRAYTFLQRDLPGTHAILTLGETFTSGDVFRSMPIMGLSINSDLGMLPDVLQGYAPVIRGVAQSRAKLEVLQNGYPIYSTYVSPGAYAIEDLSTVGGSGELEVVLTEEDGQISRRTLPYASIGNLLRRGVWRYNATVARYNSAYELEEPLLWQGTLAMGTLWNSTLYGGALASEFYRAGTLGLARDFGSAGALSLDVTHANAEVDSETSHVVQGMSYAIKYGKSFETRTNLRFAGYRYSTEGYRDFEEALRERRQDGFYGSRRSRLEASVYQNLGKSSSIGLTFSHQDYWFSDYQQRQFQLQFNTHHKGISYNLYASQALSERNGMKTNRQIGLSISLPLDFGRSTSLTYDAQKYGDRLSQRASLGGNAIDNRLSYRASVSHENTQQTSATIALGYQTAFGSVGAGFTHGRDHRNLSLNASGAVLLHDSGIEFGPYLGETMGIIEVPDIPDIGVVNSPGVRTNQRGFALVPYLRPYRVNEVQLKTDDLGPEIDIDNGTTQLIPRRGAIVKATFNARKVTRMVITGFTSAGTPLPFGARVSDSTNQELGMVGQGGQVMLSGATGKKTLQILWGDDARQGCKLHVDTSTMEHRNGYYLQTLQCQ
ncbi:MULTISPECIES: fimbria/pilus outer membrane usher protein [unclassified Pseudomonas]|uniref:fimbria/pilus outer membrane usher protein n=1 Tax=unclassified Pseudomonas TaxID=196821 RepID=UPI001473CFB9|nr:MULTISPECIES: fimbria/pilus outer membrane usher protein [unclassified Pseudomonas]NMY39446.1 fimbrial biogenesis outer membrane usher protein [Pseudomonas sp. WS 5078]NMY62188.1 fimbrial biogenesis outer membrane usher protein [Pseudomonas sp. WS 5354]